MPSPLMSKPAVAKQLRELLQEQQEPFIPEIYPYDKGYLKKSASWGPKNKRRRVMPSCSKIVKAVFKKLVGFFRNTKKEKNSASGDGNHSSREIGRRSDQDMADFERFSFSSGTTVFHSCSGSDTEGRTGSLPPDSVSSFTIGNLVEAKEIDTDRRLPWRCRKDNNEELNRVSEIEAAPFHENSQVQNKRNRVLLQSKQLLFDCVRELVEAHGSEGGRGKEFLEILEPAEIWKILSVDTRTWSKSSRNETNTTQLVDLDFTASAERWKGFNIEMREIGAVIGDAILEDFSEEIAVGIIELVE